MTTGGGDGSDLWGGEVGAVTTGRGVQCPCGMGGAVTTGGRIYSDHWGCSDH